MSSPGGSPAKVVSLTVKPSQVSKLALEASGIVGEWNVSLGDSVTPHGPGLQAFDFATFYAGLGATAPGSPAQLQYDSQGIHDDPAVAASNLLALRAEPVKAALDSAVAARANAYYAKYGNQAAIITQTLDYYAATSSGSKPQLLAELSTLAQNQASLLQAAYTADSRLGVVKNTTSTLSSYTQTEGGSSTDTNVDEQETVRETDRSETSGAETTRSAGADLSDTVLGETSSGELVVSPAQLEFTQDSGTDSSSSTGTDIITGSDVISGTDVATTQAEGFAYQTQSIINTGYGYRVPSIDDAGRNVRAQISLIDQQFAQFISGQNLPYLAQVFTNELAMIDLVVKRLQVAYLNTILLSPICGVVTGVFTNLGDPVRAGNVIIRVEDNQTVLLEGTVVYRGMISLGDSVTVQTTLFSDRAAPATITGTIVAAYGSEAGDDRWDIAVSCSNIDSSGNPIFPLHYSFDYDDTTATIF
jgi:hypothetical protein